MNNRQLAVQTHVCVCIQDLQQDAGDKDDFTTSLDNKGAAILLAIQEEKRKR